MMRTLLGLLCLLLASEGASEEGEVCHEGFLCPQRPDGTDGRFCCGTCLAPYCCDSEEARLDRDQCLHAWRTLGFFIRYLMAQSARATLPFLQDLQTTPTSDPHIRGEKYGARDPTQARPGPNKMLTAFFVFAGVASGAMLILFLVLIICKYGCSGAQGLAAFLYHRSGDASPLVSAAMGTSDPESPGPPPRQDFDAPPPYEEVRPSSQVAPSNPSAVSGGEDGPASGPWIRSLTVGGAEEAATQAPTTSEATPPKAGAAPAEEVTPGPGAAVGGENPPEQGAGGGEKATAVPRGVLPAEERVPPLWCPLTQA